MVTDKAEQYLSARLKCDSYGIADKLWPISMGFTETQRMVNLNAVLSSVQDAIDEPTIKTGYLLVIVEADEQSFTPDRVFMDEVLANEFYERNKARYRMFNIPVVL
jgi:hypothetical protein